MSYATVLKQVKTILEAVAGVKNVHDYRRHSKFWDEFFKKHVGTEKVVNSWEITRTEMAQDIRAVQGAGGNEPFYFDTHFILITGYFTVNDENATEITFQDLVDAVVAAFRVKPLLNNATIIPKEAQAPSIGHTMFGGVLVHTAEITFEAIEEVGG